MMSVFWHLFTICLAVICASGHAPRSATSRSANLPDCAISCLSTAVANSPCSATNETCTCANEAIQQQATICVSVNCTRKEALLTKNITLTSCGAPIRDRSPEYQALSIAFGTISSTFVIARFAFKIWVQLELSLDDWFALITIFAGIPSSVLIVHGTIANGLGRDIWTLSFTKITNFSKFFYIIMPLYFLQITLLKLTLLFFYQRIFPAGPIRRTLWGTIIINCLFGAVFIILAIFQCKPVSYFWMKWDGEHSGKCMDINTIVWSNSGISIVLDIWMLAIPLSQINALNLDRRKKIGAGLMFSVGTFVTVVSILRLRSLIAFGSRSGNPTWDYLDASKWSTIEINVGIICTCMPTIRLILVRIFPKLLGTTQRYLKYASKHGGAQSRSRPTETSVTSNVNRSQQLTHPNGITCHKTFVVEYGDYNDEVQLVHL